MARSKKTFRSRRGRRRYKRKAMYRARKQRFRRISNTFYHFRRSFNSTTIQSATTASGFAYTYKLADLPGLVDFSSLFDAYRINKVVTRITPLQSNINANSSDAPAQAIAFIDYDDATPPVDANEFNQRANLRYLAVTNSNVGKCPRSNIFVFRPKLITDAKDTGGTTYSMVWSSRKNPFIDMAYTSVNHYGLKVWIGPTDTLGDIKFAITHTLYFTGRNVK